MNRDQLDAAIRNIYALAEIRYRINHAFSQNVREHIGVDSVGNVVVPRRQWDAMNTITAELYNQERQILEQTFPRDIVLDVVLREKVPQKSKDLEVAMIKIRAALTTYSDTKHPLTKKLMEEISAACTL